MNVRHAFCFIFAATLVLAQNVGANDQVGQTAPATELLKRIARLEARVSKLERASTGGDVADLQRVITESEKTLVGSWILADESSAGIAGLVQIEFFADGRCHVGRAIFQDRIVGPFADKRFWAVGPKLQIDTPTGYSGALSWNRTIISVSDDELVLSWKDVDGKVTESKFKRIKQTSAEERCNDRPTN